jgi:hypothetical protein
LFANGQKFREVGLHQHPSERKGEGVPVRSLRIPGEVARESAMMSPTIPI